MTTDTPPDKAPDLLEQADLLQTLLGEGEVAVWAGMVLLNIHQAAALVRLATERQASS